MSYWLGVLDLELLRDAAPAAATGRWPRLRFVSLSPRVEAEPIVATLPEHVRRRVILDPDPDLLASGQVQALLCSDPEETAARFPGVSIDDILTWADVDDAYGSWLRAVALPEEQDRLYRPSGLIPSDWHAPALAIELIGSCGAEFVQWAVPDVARELDAKLDAILTVRNHPGPGTRTATDPVPDLRLVVPPLRYMHPATLDDLVRHPDPERLFAETVAHLRAYLDSILAELPTTDLYVCGFLEPHENPDGAFFPERSLGNFRHFVRRLNDEVVAWCERSGATHFVDGDAIAGAIGKLGIDDGVLSFFGHRAPLDVYDDNVDAECGCENVAAAASFEMRTSRFTRAIVREIVHRHLIRGQADRVKAVIVDLDNTLWRGLASDGEIGAFNGRPQGLVEALLVMRRRGIFIAIASKNDEAYIREHWEDILYRWPDEPLTVPLSLKDFDAVRIDFAGKALTVTEILDELNVLPEHAVFIDDNPLEREAVQAALPDLRVLGAELNLVRRELLYSPFTQRDVRVAEDGLRAASAATQTELRHALNAGDGSAFLRSLELGCAVSRIEDAGSLAGVRALQLINKTNQWTINAGRFGETELDARLRAGEQLLVATATDAHRSHGIVAAALICPASSSVSHLVMSCRVIGMGVDDAMMSALLDEYGPLTLDYAATDRNRGATASLRRWLGAPPTGTPTVSSVACPEHVRLTVALASASR